MSPWKWSLACLVLIACSRPEAPLVRRAELKVVSPASVHVIPAPGQLANCLVFTASERGVVRHLTMTPERRSVPCRAGEPIGGVPYTIPPAEGKVRLYVLFSSEPIGADGVAAQIHEATTRGRPLTAMDFRAPGQVQLETLEFTPAP